MSFRIVDAVFDLALSSTEKMVLCSLSRHAHNDGTEARPSVGTIMQETGFSERCVQITLRSLEGYDPPLILDAYPTYKKKGGKKRTVNYTLVLENWNAFRLSDN
jgi:hypothetical protein